MTLLSWCNGDRRGHFSDWKPQNPAETVPFVFLFFPLFSVFSVFCRFFPFEFRLTMASQWNPEETLRGKSPMMIVAQTDFFFGWVRLAQKRTCLRAQCDWDIHRQWGFSSLATTEQVQGLRLNFFKTLIPLKFPLWKQSKTAVFENHQSLNFWLPATASSGRNDYKHLMFKSESHPNARYMGIQANFSSPTYASPT